MEYIFSDRMKNMGGNAIREIFKLLARPDMISFAGGFPSAKLLPTKEVVEIMNIAKRNHYKVIMATRPE